MIRTLLAQEGGLARGALAFVLDAEADIEVVATVSRLADVVKAAEACSPRVAVVDLDLLAPDELPELVLLQKALPECQLLALVEARRSHVVESMMARPPAGLGFVAKDGPPGRLVNAVRQAATGEPVLDPELVVSTLRHGTPLTSRETEVLRVAAEGMPAKEIAQRLRLAPGTVRNHMSRVISKVGARTSIEAVRIAQESGWI